jgi:hypothetical protein
MKNKFYFIFIFILVANVAMGQGARFRFHNESVVEGTAGEVNAVYRFNGVASGTDALVKVTAITGGVELAKVDGPQGWDDALQPVVKATSGDSGYVELEITFVGAGTDIPQIQAEVPVTSIDIDGNHEQSGSGTWLKEFDEMKLTANSYYNYMNAGGHLSMMNSNGWLCGRNNMMTEHTDIDTVAREVMFTVTHSNVSKIMIRCGVINRDNNTFNRQRSVYFKGFAYPSAFLSIDKNLALNGVVNNKTGRLSWTLGGNNTVINMQLEKSTDARNWNTAFTATRNDGTVVSNGRNFGYTDMQLAAGKTYYRLKQVTTTGEIAYSNVIVLNNAEGAAGFKVYPTAFTTSTTVQLQSDNNSQALITVTDMNGRAVYQNKLNVNAGVNNLQLNDLGKIQNAGQYLITVNVNGVQQTAKVVKY